MMESISKTKRKLDMAEDPRKKFKQQNLFINIPDDDDIFRDSTLGDEHAQARRSANQYHDPEIAAKPMELNDMDEVKRVQGPPKI